MEVLYVFLGWFLLISIIISIDIIKIKRYKKTKKVEKKKYNSMLIFIIMFIILIIGLVAFTIYIRHDDLYYPCTNGKYKSLHKEKNMTCEVKEEGNDNIVKFSDGSCIFIIKNDIDLKLYDVVPLNIKCEENVLSKIYNYQEGTIEMLYDNLKTTAAYYEGISKTKIALDNIIITITFNSKTSEINYDFNKTDTYQNYLEIMHIDDNYYEFDKILLNLLFNKDINDFYVTKENNMVKYTLLNAE